MKSALPVNLPVLYSKQVAGHARNVFGVVVALTKVYEMIYCACGCGQQRTKYTIEDGRERKDRPKLYITHHNQKGYKPTEETRRKTSESMKGKNKGNKNGMWKDSPKYAALHLWVRNHLPQPEYCQECIQVPPYDLANVTGIYNRELDNWLYLCRKCHMKSDNRLLTMINRNYRKDYNYNINRDPKTGRFIRSSCSVA
jgi:hypothetical protein